MHVALQQPTAGAERYGTFRGDASSRRHRREPKSVAAMLVLALLATLLLYASPFAQTLPGASLRDAATTHHAQPAPLQSNEQTIESAGRGGSVQSARVFYNKGGNTVSIQFSTGVVTEPFDSSGGADAWATFNDSLHAIGWSQLWINTTALHTRELHDPVLAHQRRKEIMFAAGYAEGALTHRRIDEHFTNVYLTFFPNGDAAEHEALAGLQTFLRENLAWMRAQVAFYEDGTHTKLDDAQYWAAIGTILAQFDGLVQGYRRFSMKKQPANEIDLFMLNADGDLEDLIPAIQRRQQHVSGASLSATAAANVVTKSFYTFVKNLKCSALIRILPDFADLVWGHATWDTYSSMNRIYKHYEVPLPPFDATPSHHFHNAASARRKISMSSSPGYLSSVDDWYMTNAGLGVMETTHGVFDNDLYAFVTPKSVLCWLRSKVANLVGEDGMSWAATFSKFNSGTYNDQWMIIDTKRFVQGEGFQPNGLTVLEQLPGFIHVEDVSETVNDVGYWGSYNVPYFPSVYDRSGFRAVYFSTNESASWSHANCTRAKIFQRDAPTIRSFDDLKRMMRYNNWRDDPLSSGHASHAVASRYDLETEPTLFALDGAIDAKVTSWTRMQHGRLECDAVSGPTHDQNPVFEWTEALSKQSAHCGQPQRFDFAYETMMHDSVRRE